MIKLWALICYDKGDDKQNINLIFKSSKILIGKPSLMYLSDFKPVSGNQKASQIW